jgi:hypothetical protein
VADQAFDRTILNVRERPTSGDVNRGFSESDRTWRDMLLFMLGQGTQASRFVTTIKNGFLGSSLSVFATTPTSMQVVISGGIGFQQDPSVVPPTVVPGLTATGVTDLSIYKPINLSSLLTATVPPADPAFPRIDRIEVRFNRSTLDATSRSIFDIIQKKFLPGTVQKTFSWDLLPTGVANITTPTASTNPVSYVAGTPAAMPVAPPPTPGYVTIALINVPALVAVINPSNIVDARPVVAPGDKFRVMGRVSVPTGGGVATLSGVDAPPGFFVATIVPAGANPTGQVTVVVICPGSTSIAGGGSPALASGTAFPHVTVVAFASGAAVTSAGLVTPADTGDIGVGSGPTQLVLENAATTNPAFTPTNVPAVEQAFTRATFVASNFGLPLAASALYDFVFEIAY